MFAVALGGVEDRLGRDTYAVGGYLVEEATDAAGVASRSALLANLQEQGVAVAIDEDLLYFLVVAAFFPLAPKPTTAATVIHGPTGRQRFGETFGVHVGEHEHDAGFGILRNGRQQAVGRGGEIRNGGGGF